ncbi:MAG: epimerase [Burkholderiales bacterium PBB6]|nr:MAG: epimerase [Burkholderiales bacterium PBB6]
MNVLITGAAGFVGCALARRLQAEASLGGRPLQRLILTDLGFGDSPAPGGITQHLAGDLTDAAWLDAALTTALGAEPIDVIFHLASVPGGMAEANPALARRVNLDATQWLLARGQQQVEAGGPAPVFVFASSIAVFGALPAEVNDDTALRPLLTYGAHKVVGEVLVDDFSRRGWVDGRSLRLPGVLARPPQRTGQLSAFLSDMIREVAAGRSVICPMSPQATTWASSITNVVENLLHAAVVDTAGWGQSRAITLPTVRYSMSELVDALVAQHGPAARSLISHAPQPHIEALFGRFPLLSTPRALAAGFQSDASLAALVTSALD